MSKIISFATQKGGSGKSTLSVLTATAINNRTNNKVLVIDADPQQTISGLHNREKDNGKSYDMIFFNWRRLDEKDYQKLLSESIQKYDIIIVDVPGTMGGEEIFYSILFSDIVCVPIVPRVFDISSTIDFLKTLPTIAEKRKKTGRTFKVFGIPNKMDNTKETNYIDKINGVGGVQLFGSGLSNKIRYGRNISTVNTITADNVKDEFNHYFHEFITKILYNG